MRALVVGASPHPGEDDFYREVLRRAEVVIAADAAGEWCIELGRTPDAVVGDFDSAEVGAAERLEAHGVMVERHPATKDVSDLDLCASAAKRMGAEAITFTAAFSRRIDHTLAALGSMLRAAPATARLLEPDLVGWVLDASGRSRVEFEAGEGVVFTVVAPMGATGVEITGAAYELDGATLGMLDSLGLSNVSTGGGVTVEIGTGPAFVLVNTRPNADYCD